MAPRLNRHDGTRALTSFCPHAQRSPATLPRRTRSASSERAFEYTSPKTPSYSHPITFQVPQVHHRALLHSNMHTMDTHHSTRGARRCATASKRGLVAMLRICTLSARLALVVGHHVPRLALRRRHASLWLDCPATAIRLHLFGPGHLVRAQCLGSSCCTCCSIHHTTLLHH